MADMKLTQLALYLTDIAAGDFLYVVDTASNTSRRVTKSHLLSGRAFSATNSIVQSFEGSPSTGDWRIFTNTTTNRLEAGGNPGRFFRTSLDRGV